MCKSGRDVMGLPLRAPHSRSDPFFGSAWGSASRAATGRPCPAGPLEVWPAPAGRKCGRASVGGNLLRARAPGLLRRALWRRSLCRLLVRLLWSARGLEQWLHCRAASCARWLPTEMHSARRWPAFLCNQK